MHQILNLKIAKSSSCSIYTFSILIFNLEGFLTVPTEC